MPRQPKAIARRWPRLRVGCLPSGQHRGACRALSSAAYDDLFAEDSPAFADPSVVPLASTGGVVKPELPIADRLYRLVGEVPAGPGTACQQMAVLPEMIQNSGLHYDHARNETKSPKRRKVKDLFGPCDILKFFRSKGFPAGPIRFAYASYAVPPTAIKPVEALRLHLKSLKAEQAQGFAKYSELWTKPVTRSPSLACSPPLRSRRPSSRNQKLSEGTD